MNTVRGNLIYTAVATVVFLGIQVFDNVRDVPLLAISGGMFFAFTFFMLRLIQRVMNVVTRGQREKRRERDERERGPSEFEPTTSRPDHVRRRRDRRRRRR